MSSRTVAALLLLLSPLAGCSASDGAADSTEDDLRTTCTATYRTLQKDAYKNTGGRTTPLWPPHTTTDLEIRCGGQQVGYAVQANHGSAPGQKDASGREFLDVVKTETRTASKKELLALLAQYETCGCAPDKFLGLDTLKSTVASDLLASLLPIVERDVTCKGGVDALIAALKAQDFEAATKLLPTCTFKGADLKAALDEAMAKVAAAGKGVLADYHVCNNDAELQAELFHGFSAQHTQGFCSTTSALCRGPSWYYTP